MNMQQLLMLDAVITQGSFQAAADFLHRTHPSVIAGLGKLEDELGFALFDRSGYRTVLTEQGMLFYERSKRMLGEMQSLRKYAVSIRDGEAAEIDIVIGDVTPLTDALSIIRGFGEQHPDARLNLFFENLSGPNERLLSGEVDLIIHHIDKADPRYDYKDFCRVPIVPVVAPGFLRIPVDGELRYSDLRGYTQCIIRDTSKGEDSSYFVLPDSPQITVGDQHTKKEIIMQRMGWGHMPLFMVQDELECGRLVSIQGEHIRGATVEIVAARQSAREHGRLAEHLWQLF